MTGTSARYDEIAESYAASFSEPLDSPVDRALLELAGDVVGTRLLDLACGHGRFARAFAERGADVVGVDVALALLEMARAIERETPLGISYVHADVASVDALAGERFAAVACGFGLSDIDDLDGTLATVARLLPTDGLFVFSLLHPCFPGWGEDVSSSWPRGGYFREGWWLAQARSSTLRQKVGANHRMLSTYLNALVRRGFILEEVVEPPLPAQWASDRPEADPVPVFLVARCRKR